MSKNRMGIQFSGYKELTEQLDKLLGGSLKKTTENALIKSKNHVTEKLEAVTNKENFPSKGRFSTGKTKKAIDTSQGVEWNGTEGKIDVGFDLKKGGLTSIFLMYGTPRMKPVKGLYEAIYGKQTTAEVRKIQKQVFEEEIKKVMK